MNSEFLKPCDLEKIRTNWSPKFGRMGVDHNYILSKSLAQQLVLINSTIPVHPIAACMHACVLNIIQPYVILVTWLGKKEKSI